MYGPMSTPLSVPICHKRGETQMLHRLSYHAQPRRIDAVPCRVEKDHTTHRIYNTCAVSSLVVLSQNSHMYAEVVMYCHATIALSLVVAVDTQRDLGNGLPLPKKCRQGEVHSSLPHTLHCQHAWFMCATQYNNTHMVITQPS